MSDCLFCKIAAGEVPVKSIYEDDYVIAFHDIMPKAPVHFLVVSKEHIESAAKIDGSNSHFVAKCFEAIAKIAENEGLNNGFRVITNSGPEGGQTVFHLHYHVLGGKLLGDIVDRK